MPDSNSLLTDVLVVGAGPSGLALAAELRLRGISVVLVDREVSAAVQERFFDLFDEQAFTANLTQRAILNAVAGGHHLQLFEAEARVCLLQLRDECAALSQREGALASSVGEPSAGHVSAQEYS